MKLEHFCEQLEQGTNLQLLYRTNTQVRVHWENNFDAKAVALESDRFSKSRRLFFPWSSEVVMVTAADLSTQPLLKSSVLLSQFMST